MKFFPRHPLEAHIRETTIDICRSYSIRSERTLGEKVAKAKSAVISFLKSWQGLGLAVVIAGPLMFVGQSAQWDKNNKDTREISFNCASDGGTYYAYSEYVSRCPGK